MNETQSKRPRPEGRLSQLSKKSRLHRRFLGQWRTPPLQQRLTTSNFSIPQWTFAP